MENTKLTYEAPDASIEVLDSEDTVLVSLEHIPWDDLTGEGDW